MPLHYIIQRTRNFPLVFIDTVLSSFLERLRAYMQHYLNNPQIISKYEMHPKIFHEKRVILIRCSHHFMIKTRNLHCLSWKKEVKAGCP